MEWGNFTAKDGLRQAQPPGFDLEIQSFISACPYPLAEPATAMQQHRFIDA
jgi:hypothetical protein